MAAKDNFNKQIEDVRRQLKIISIIAIIASVLFLVLLINPNGFSFETTDTEQSITEVNDDLIENGIHVRTGFKEVDGLMTVVQNCTSCHSSKLVIQNRMNADRWNATIKWMQETQNLWDLGENQEVIVNYLVANYPPVEKGRRGKIKDVEWYELK
jgi:hypothetical protein